MKTTCKHCGIVDKPHKCPHITKANNSREDKKIYKDKRYRKVRGEVLKNHKYKCLWSLYIGSKVKAANDTHHIEEVLDHEELAFEYDNLIPLTQSNHEIVHELYKKDKPGTQKLLRMMLNDYKNNDMTIGKYKNYFL